MLLRYEKSILKSEFPYTNYLKIAPPRLRGILLGGLAFFTTMMQFIGLGIVRGLVPNLQPAAFRTAFALQWLVGAIPIIAFFLVPE